MELNHYAEMYNEAAEKFNELLGRYQALQKELAEAKEEAQGWKRKFLAVQQTEAEKAEAK